MIPGASLFLSECELWVIEGYADHIGGTQYLLMGLNFGEKTAASQSGEPGILRSQ